MTLLSLFFGLICSQSSYATTTVTSAESANIKLGIGIRYFREQDFPAALEQFLQLVDEGHVSGKLYYNIAVAYYRLEDYANAQENFSRASIYPQAQQLSHYNLGRCAEKLQQAELAAYWYERAEQGENARIIELAKRAKAQVGQKNPSQIRWAIDFRWGLDTAVVGFSEEVDSRPTDVPDLYQQIDIRFAHRKKNPLGRGYWRWGTQAYWLKYEDIPSLDIHSLGANWDYRQLLFGGQGQLRFELGQDWLDGHPYQFRPALQFAFSQSLLGGLGRAALAHIWVEPQKQADEGIRGSFLQATGLWLKSYEQHQFSLVTRFEWNERRSELRSPQRWVLQSAWRLPRRGFWRYQLRTQWRHSRYNERVLPNERRWRTSLTMENIQSERWSTWVEFSHESNDSSLSTQAYEHTRLQLGFKFLP